MSICMRYLLGQRGVNPFVIRRHAVSYCVLGFLADAMRRAKDVTLFYGKTFGRSWIWGIECNLVMGLFERNSRSGNRKSKPGQGRERVVSFRN